MTRHTSLALALLAPALAHAHDGHGLTGAHWHATDTVGLLASGVALADAHLDPQLVQKLAGALPTDELQVVVTYEQSGPVTAAQVQALKALGIEKGVTMHTLPIAGALATPAEIAALRQRDDVVSIYYNAPLRFFNKEQREWCVGEAMVVTGFQFTPVELIEKGDAAMARLILDARKGG